MDYVFPQGFQWGVSTASYQIEGGCREGGRGESIWDRFTHIDGNIPNNENGDIACDFYHHYRDDIAKVHEMGIPNFRFSIAWPRIFPENGEDINEEGLQFYDNVLKELEKYGIKAAVTLYHWDMPQWLQDKGGWQNRESIEYFRRYCETVMRRFDGRVAKWMTLNEPWVCAFNGHYWGNFAPGIRDFSAALQTAHHMLCAHGAVVDMFRREGLEGEIGIVLNLCPREPDSDSEADKAAAVRNDGFANRWFLDPIYLGKYPQDMADYYREMGLVLPKIKKGDMELISGKIDFLGINYYYIEFTKACEGNWPLGFQVTTKDYPLTEYGWPIIERGLSDLLIRLDRDYGHPVLYVTENGASFLDCVNIKGKVLDETRLDYIERHILACHRAVESGVDLRGYFIWTLLDDFEWSTGYRNRFGLIYVDHRDHSRIIKKSGRWYRKIIQANGIVQGEEKG